MEKENKIFGRAKELLKEIREEQRILTHDIKIPVYGKINLYKQFCVKKQTGNIKEDFQLFKENNYKEEWTMLTPIFYIFDNSNYFYKLNKYIHVDGSSIIELKNLFSTECEFFCETPHDTWNCQKDIMDYVYKATCIENNMKKLHDEAR